MRGGHDHVPGHPAAYPAHHAGPEAMLEIIARTVFTRTGSSGQVDMLCHRDEELGEFSSKFLVNHHCRKSVLDVAEGKECRVMQEYYVS